MQWKLFSLAILLSTVGPVPAHAYIDPGTGSILVQAAIGAVIAAGLFARSWWRRLLMFLRLSKPSQSAGADRTD